MSEIPLCEQSQVRSAVCFGEAHAHVAAVYFFLETIIRMQGKQLYPVKEINLHVHLLKAEQKALMRCWREKSFTKCIPEIDDGEENINPSSKLGTVYVIWKLNISSKERG